MSIDEKLNQEPTASNQSSLFSEAVQKAIDAENARLLEALEIEQKQIEAYYENKEANYSTLERYSQMSIEEIQEELQQKAADSE